MVHGEFCCFWRCFLPFSGGPERWRLATSGESRGHLKSSGDVGTSLATPDAARGRQRAPGDFSWDPEMSGDVPGDVWCRLDTSNEPRRHLESSGDVRTSLDVRERLDTFGDVS